MIVRQSIKPGLSLALAAVTAVSLAACSGGSQAPTAQPQGAKSALLPASIASSGTIKVGMSIASPPMEYYKSDNTTATGVDVEIAQAIAAKLGVTATFVNTKWAGLIPALNTHRYDLIMSSMGDFTNRQKQLDFVDYLSMGEGGVVDKAHAGEFTTPMSLCGKKVGATVGTVAIKAAQDTSAKCTAAGNPAVQISTFPDDNSGLLAVRTGRVELHIMDLPMATYEAANAEGGNTYSVVLPNMTGGIPYGIGVAKGNTQLTNAVKTALDEIIKSGEYGAILEKHGLSIGAVKSAVVNGGTTSSE